MRGLKFFIWFMSVFSLGSTALAADSIREGKWEFITQMQMGGMPKMPELPPQSGPCTPSSNNGQMKGMPKMSELPPGIKLPPGVNMSRNGNGIQMTVTKCVTKEDVVPASRQGQNNCKVTRMEKNGNRVNWSVYCKENDTEMTGDGIATYTGDTMDSKIVMTTRDKEGHSMKHTSTIKGKYLGPCK